MLSLRKIKGEFGLHLEDVPLPHSPSDHEVQIQVHATGICGSDLHVYEWTPGYEFMLDRLPVTIGHEFSGTIVAAGQKVEGLASGDRVTVWPTTACGKCFHCLASRPQDCQAREVIGLHINGGFSAFVNVPEQNCYRIPDNLTLDLAALSEPLSIAENALDVGDCRSGDAVVVLGPGPIGLAIAWLAQYRGCGPVLLAGFNDSERLGMAARMGIAHRVDLKDESLFDATERVFGRKVDRVIEASGATQSVTDGLAIIRSSGVLVVAGIHSEPIEIALTQMVRDKKQIRAAHDTCHEAFGRVVEILAQHSEVFSEMITHTLVLSDALKGFEIARHKTSMKILIKPECTA